MTTSVPPRVGTGTAMVSLGLGFVYYAADLDPLMWGETVKWRHRVSRGV